MSKLHNLERKLELLLRSPRDAGVYNDIGVILYQMNDPENAEAYLHRAYELLPSNPDILYDYAVILFARLKWREAIPILEKVLDVDPKSIEIRAKIGDAYYQLGKYDEAAKTYGTLQ